MRTSRFLCTLVALAAVAACDSGEPTTPQVDVDAALSQMATGGISTYTTVAAAAAAAAAGGVSLPVPGSATAASCPYNAATSFFVCVPVTQNGMTFSRSFQLLDASNAPLSTANPLAVAAIRSVIDLQGSMSQTTPSQMTIQMNRHEDATLSGIQSTSRVLNGTATQAMTLTLSQGSMTSSETSVTSNLLLPSSSAQKYPLGGKITTTGSVTAPGTTAQAYTREISFDGSSIMTMKMTSGGLTMTCKIDLANPGATPTCT